MPPAKEQRHERGGICLFPDSPDQRAGHVCLLAVLFCFPEGARGGLCEPLCGDAAVSRHRAGVFLPRLASAEDILSLVAKTEAEFKSLEETNSGDIFVGAPESEAMSLFAEAVHTLQKNYPRIRCNIYSGNLSDVCERLDKGLLDFAIVMSYVDLSKYNYLELPMKDTWGILMRKDDPLAGKSSFAASDLDKLPLICSRQWIDQESPRWLGAAAKDMHIVALYNLVFNGSVMVRAGMGYAVVLDKLVNTGEESDLAFIPLSGVPQTEMYVIWRKYQTFTPIANLLLQELKTRLC